MLRVKWKENVNLKTWREEAACEACAQNDDKHLNSP